MRAAVWAVATTAILSALIVAARESSAPNGIVLEGDVVGAAKIEAIVVPSVAPQFVPLATRVYVNLAISERALVHGSVELQPARVLHDACARGGRATVRSDEPGAVVPFPGSCTFSFGAGSASEAARSISPACGWRCSSALTARPFLASWT